MGGCNRRAIGGLLAIFWPLLPLPIGFLIQAGTFAGSALIFDWLPLRLLLVPGRIKREHCVGLARREFAARILADHEHRPGMLLFVSLGERHVEILADNAYTCVGRATWNRAIATFMTAPKPKQFDCGWPHRQYRSLPPHTLEMHYPRA